MSIFPRGYLRRHCVACKHPMGDHGHDFVLTRDGKVTVGLCCLTTGCTCGYSCGYYQAEEACRRARLAEAARVRRRLREVPRTSWRCCERTLWYRYQYRTRDPFSPSGVWRHRYLPMPWDDPFRLPLPRRRIIPSPAEVAAARGVRA